MCGTLKGTQGHTIVFFYYFRLFRCTHRVGRQVGYAHIVTQVYSRNQVKNKDISKIKDTEKSTFQTLLLWVTEGEDAWHRALQPELNPLDPYGSGRELTSEVWPLAFRHVLCVEHTQHTQSN